jgi:ZIP family zinc transporter
MAIGLTLVKGGGVSVAMIVAVFLSNIPEGLTSSTGLLADGWKKRSVIGLWIVVVAMSSFSALLGYTVFADTSGATNAFILSFAGGAILTMLADTMIPEAYRDSGKLTGIIMVLGFCLAYAITTFE